MIERGKQRFLSMVRGGVCLTVLCGAAPCLASDLRIEVAEEGWGDASVADVKAVLVCAAEPLWKAAGSPQLPIIRVEASGGPIVLFRRDDDGAIRVRLAVQGRHWAQIAYQFSHEMGHILCGFDEDPDPHHWLEETLCEAASLLVLRKMARRWKQDPPYPNWTSYAPHLEQYVQKLIERGALPEGETIDGWYKKHRVEVKSTPVKRERLLVIAVAWLPLLEKEPQAWRAVRYLNHGVPEPEESLARALRRWKSNCPEQDRVQVDRLAQMLGINIKQDLIAVEDVVD